MSNFFLAAAGRHHPTLRGNAGTEQCGGGTLSPSPESGRIALPVVAAADVPSYPSVARVAEVQGDVRIRVTTDGGAWLAPMWRTVEAHWQ
jgi:hypothetical protein